jgi:hypothetical protein
MTSGSLDDPGDYTIFLVGGSGDGVVKLGQSTMVYVEDPEE